MQMLWKVVVILFRIAAGLAGVAFSLLLIVLALGSEQASAEEENANPVGRAPAWRDADGNWFDIHDRPV